MTARRQRRPAPVAIDSSTVCGSTWRRCPEQWGELDFARAWVDPGLGGGPYLKAPRVVRDAAGKVLDETVHRVRPLARLGARYPERIDGLWHWMPAASVAEAEAVARKIRAEMRGDGG